MNDTSSRHLHCKHFREPDGSLVCICLRCFLTIARGENEPDLHKAVGKHACSPHSAIFDSLDLKEKVNPQMKSLGNLYRHHQLLLVILFTAAMLSTAAGQTASTAPAKTTQLMFVQSAEDLKVDTVKSTFRLVKVNQQTLYFSDRPERIAGHLKMAQYLAEWGKAEGADNFSNDPPNAILSVFEPKQDDNTITVVKISHPVVDGDDLVYSYKIIQGTHAQQRWRNCLVY